MIYESTPWKEELLKAAVRLKRKSTQKRWTARSSFVVERDIMVSAYAIRKLLEAHKLSDELQFLQVETIQYSLVGDVPDAWNRHEFYDSYDLESGVATHLPVRELCNQIIHSWVFILSATEAGNEFDGIFVCSDRARRSYLYFIAAKVLIRLFETIGSEIQRSVRMEFNSQEEMTIVEVIGERPPAT
jgi:hypothetical protein